MQPLQDLPVAVLLRVRKAGEVIRRWRRQGAMTMHLNEITHPCPHCGRRISRPNYNRHAEACERKRAQGRQLCICAGCGRTVGGRVPAKGYGDNVVPYRHLPPAELGRGSYRHEDGTTSWFGAERWCRGSWMAAELLEAS